MSYILEALKRADAERQRGAVPSLLASQVTTPLAGVAPHGRKRAVWMAVTALVLGGLAAGLWAWRTPVQTARVPAPSSVLTPGLPSAPTPAPALLLASASPAFAAPKPAPAASTIGSQHAIAPRPNPVVQATAQGIAAPTVAPDAPIAAAPVYVPLLSELPQDLRRGIPALTITGAVYSDNPAQRLLVVNNQVLAQGSLVAPDLRLEEIQSKSSLFIFRGTRFRVAH